jgi:hypothetical protein
MTLSIFIIKQSYFNVMSNAYNGIREMAVKFQVANWLHGSLRDDSAQWTQLCLKHLSCDVILWVGNVREGMPWILKAPPPRVSLTYKQNDRRLSMKLVPAFVDRRCHVVSVTDPYGCILDFLDRSRYCFLNCTHEAEWTPFQTDYLSENLVAPGIELGRLNL